MVRIAWVREWRSEWVSQVNQSVIHWVSQEGTLGASVRSIGGLLGIQVSNSVMQWMSAIASPYQPNTHTCYFTYIHHVSRTAQSHMNTHRRNFIMSVTWHDMAQHVHTDSHMTCCHIHTHIHACIAQHGTAQCGIALHYTVQIAWYSTAWCPHALRTHTHCTHSTAWQAQHAWHSRHSMHCKHSMVPKVRWLASTATDPPNPHNSYT